MSQEVYLDLAGYKVACEPRKEGFEATQNLWYAKKAIQNIIRNRHLCDSLMSAWSYSDKKDLLVRICEEVAVFYNTAKFHQNYLLKELHKDIESRYFPSLFRG